MLLPLASWWARTQLDRWLRQSTVFLARSLKSNDRTGAPFSDFSDQMLSMPVEPGSTLAG
jgi:hypothetical protein